MSRIPVLTTNNQTAQQYNNINPGSTHDSQSTNGSKMSQASYRSPTPSSNDAFDTRKRQSRRDEAIRKKIESQLNLKAGKPSTPTQRSSGNRRRKPIIAGTVSALRPLPALTVPQNISVADASQLCAAKRTDCVLVVDEEEHLAGIFTAKDLAFRVVAGGLDPRNTPVHQIMTRSPMVTRDTTSATEALNTMVTRGFRHLPVCNEEGDVVGLLDIAKVFYEALEKLERAHGSSQKLYNALEGVQTEWGGGSAAGGHNAMLQYVEALRQKMSIPDLTTILDSRTLPCTVGVRTTVCDAAKIMKEHRTTAVCVMEGGSQTVPPKIAGIFTSKDVVLRVIAAGLDPKTCSVVRVMTPHPDTAPPSMSIQEALRKMHDGRYLNLPVVDVDARLVGVVDVLKLTYATLEQINSMNDGNGAGGEGEGENGGPMWNRFWNSFGQTATGSVGGTGTVDDNESALSGSHAMPHQTPDPSSRSQLPDLSSDLHPNDSASAVAHNDDAASGIGLANGLPLGAAAVDDGTYLFKFVTPSGRTHRFSARYDNYETIREIVSIKLSGDPFFDAPTPLPPSPAHSPEALAQESSDAPSYARVAAQPPAQAPDPNDFTLAYTDDEDDVVAVTADGDIEDSVKVARKQGKDRVVLLLQGGKAWQEAQARLQQQAGNDRTARRKARESTDAAQLQSVKEEEEQQQQKRGEDGDEVKPKKKSASDEELLFGVLPKDMALPAAIGFLGVAVLVAVTMTKSSGGR